MDERTEERSTSMSAGDTRRTQQVEEIRALWARVKPSVWTVPMLTALEQGVKGGKWFRLNDKVFAERNLEAAFQKVSSKKGASGVGPRLQGCFAAGESVT